MSIVFLDDTPYLGMYTKIHWRKINKVHFDTFGKLLEQDKQIMDLINIVYKYETRPQQIILVESIVKGVNNTLCEDVNIGFNLLCHEVKGGTGNLLKSQIFHIALHSRKPKWTESDGCQKWPLDTSKAYINFGPFHYKIDRVEPLIHSASSQKCKSDEIKKKIDEMSIPYKQFNYDDQCYFLANDDKFTNDDILNLYPECEYLHKLIYNKFINYWNTTILPVVKINPPSLPCPSYIAPSPPSDIQTRELEIVHSPQTTHTDGSASTSDVHTLARETVALEVVERNLFQLLKDLELKDTADDKQKFRDNRDQLIKGLTKPERTLLMNWAPHDKSQKEDKSQKKKKLGGKVLSYRNKRLYKKSKITRRSNKAKKSRTINYIK